MHGEFIKKIRLETGCSLQQCNKAVKYFGYNMKACVEWLKLMSQAVCTRNTDGSLMTEQDRVEYIKKIYGEEQHEKL